MYFLNERKRQHVFTVLQQELWEPKPLRSLALKKTAIYKTSENSVP